ncbi:MAG: aminodeoxyfutalosine deaminase [Acidobacteriota bacterium]|jgi:cytosine/adenosine deaminase-related metal-dependent hydrolase
MSQLYRARWILPIATPPRRDGWVLTDAGTVVRTGANDESPTAFERSSVIDEIDLGNVAILPGLVNAHTHLELSWMRGRVPPGGSMPEWASRLMALRRSVSAEPREPIVDAVREVRAAGTALVGDVTNTLAAYDVLADSELGGAVFRELLGFSADNPQQVVADASAQLDALMPIAWLRPSLVPHAPYSVSPALFRAIAAVAGARAVSVHLGESAEELRFLREGTGAWRELLARLGAWTDSWIPPGCGPVEYLDRLGLVSPQLLAVHGTHFDADETARLAQAGATIVVCPRSNRWTGAGTPPIAQFYASGVRVAVGTDSLASVEDLNLFSELAAVRRLAPDVPAARLLESATLHGASALGFGAEFGAIAPGLRADLIAVRIPPGVEDVEEYLVSGIEPHDVRWLA